MGSRPVPVPVMAELKKYVSGLDAEQEKIFNDRFSQYRWEKIRQKVGLADFKFHDLRKHADTPIMPSKVLHNGPLSCKMAHIVQFNKAYSA